MGKVRQATGASDSGSHRRSRLRRALVPALARAVRAVRLALAMGAAGLLAACAGTAPPGDAPAPADRRPVRARRPAAAQPPCQPELALAAPVFDQLLARRGDDPGVFANLALVRYDPGRLAEAAALQARLAAVEGIRPAPAGHRASSPA